MKSLLAKLSTLAPKVNPRTIQIVLLLLALVLLVLGAGAPSDGGILPRMIIRW